MTYAVGIVNLILGVAYTGYGVMTAVEMKREWRTMGFSHFGAAWIAMAFTCGPHHLFHGIHTTFEGRAPGALDFVAVAVGLPAGVLWLLLRVEAFAGGRGDRFVSGTPLWLKAMPTVAAVYLTALLAALLRLPYTGFELPTMMIPNVLLFGIYVTIGYVLLRTQLRTRSVEGGWSVSGCALSVVFPTCAIMHAVWIAYAATGVWHFDIHGFAIDWLGVPAGLYFLWVVRRLYQDSLRDWNQSPASAHELVVPLPKTNVPAPDIAAMR